MDSSNLISLLALLDDDIDGLAATLVPLTKNSLPDIASRLPLLDKAQLYILVTYAIENILFCWSPLLKNYNVREHAVYREITRVKQYFEKIKFVENAGSKRENLSLDKPAARRMIKHALIPKKQDRPKPSEQLPADRQMHNGKTQFSHGEVAHPGKHREYPKNWDDAPKGPKPPEIQGSVDDNDSPRKKRKKSKSEKQIATDD
ncbi:MAG: hypothetical protein Q9216_000580 [Gyalolechia sp. 2 TL-2023]